MSKVKRYTPLFILLLLSVMLLSSVANASEYHYATTDMTWAEFYAGETGQTSTELSEAGLDAVSSSTIAAAGSRNLFPQLSFDIISNDTEQKTLIYGVKDVKVRMTDDVYNALTDKTRYTFSDDAVFEEYKEVSADGSFGKMITETIEAKSADVTVSSGSSSTWGSYTLKVANANITVGEPLARGNDTRYWLGATITTSDDKVYGLRHDSNLWYEADTIALSVADFTEPHGVTRDYEYTADLAGKTITKITYMLLGSPDVVINCNVFLKEQTDATVSPDKGSYNAGDTVTFTFTDAPDGVTYDVNVLGLGAPGRHGLTFNAVDKSFWTYNTATRQLVLSSELPTGTYRVTFVSDQYSDINSKTFTVTGTYAYATTDMTYKEFYETEGIDNALSMDAVSSATVGKAERFAVLSYDVVSADPGVASADGNITKIYGLKDVQLRFDASYWNTTASADTRYTASTVPFVEYKVVDSSGNFGKLSTDLVELTDATVTLTSPSTWGNYLLTLDGIDSVDVSEKYLGAVLETSDGATYGLQHLYNLFFKKGEMAFCITDFTEPHKNTPAYAHTADLEGKTITKVTYLLKDTADYYVNCNVYVKNQNNASVYVPGGYVAPGSNVPVYFTFNGIPDDANYTLSSVQKGSGRNRTAITDYTFENNTLIISDELVSEDNYTVTFSDTKYADISASFTVKEAHYATTDMTWAEFYAGETGETSDDLLTSGLDAISTPTVGHSNRFPLLSSDESEGTTTIGGVKAVQVRMTEDVYNTLSNDSRYTFIADSTFTEYKEVSADGSFGKMATASINAKDAVVTIVDGISSTWGNYTLKISSADIDIGLSGDKIARNYLGVTIKAVSGDEEKVYGMRHDNNLWSTADDIAFCVSDDYVEPHGKGVKRFYEYTRDLQGWTIKQITFMLYEKPDVIIPCDLFVKNYTNASVKPVYEDGWHVINPEATNVVTLSFDNIPSGASYAISSVLAGSGRNRNSVTDYTYADNKLTVTNGLTESNYRVVFSSDNYVDIGTDIAILNTNATNLVISADKNLAGLMFLLTPRGSIDDVDKEMEDNKLIPASECVILNDSYTASYNDGENNVADSGFELDIVVSIDAASSDYAAIVGIGKMLNLTPTNLGTEGFALLKNMLDTMTVGDSGYYEFGKFSDLASAGLRVTAVNDAGVLSDMSELAGAGLQILDNSTILIFYGTMFADAASLANGNGEYYLSPEGEFLVADGAKDGHIKATLYIEKVATSSPTDTGNGGNPVTDTEPNGGAGTTPPKITPQTAKPEAPSATLQTNIQNEAVVETVVKAIKNLFSGLPDTVTSLTPLTADTNKSTKIAPNAEDLSATQRASIEAKSQDIAVIIDPIKVEKPGIYVFAIDPEKFSALEPGWPIFIYMLTDTLNGSAIEISANEENAAVFINDAGEVIKELPDDKKVNVSAYMEANTDYTPVITTYVEDEDNVGSSGGGCEVGFGFMALVGLLACMKKK